MTTMGKTKVRASGGTNRRGMLLNPGHTIPRVSAAELKFAMGVAFAAAALSGPYPTPSKNELTMHDEDTGELTTYRFADSAFARAGFAVVEQFKEEPGKGVALLMRWSELMRLIADERMQPFMRKASDGSGAVHLRHEAVEVAAELPFDGEKRFNTHDFFRDLKARVSEYMRE
jgi:hypothetical protein